MTTPKSRGGKFVAQIKVIPDPQSYGLWAYHVRFDNGETDSGPCGFVVDNWDLNVLVVKVARHFEIDDIREEIVVHEEGDGWAEWRASESGYVRRQDRDGKLRYVPLASIVSTPSDDAYWLYDIAYCPTCWESGKPGYSADEKAHATREPGTGRCGCCRELFPGEED